MTDSYTAEERALAKQMLDNAKRDQIASQGISHARKVGKKAPAIHHNQNTRPEDLLHPIVSSRSGDRKCRGCDGPLDEITVGCNTCRCRHNARRAKLRGGGMVR